MYELPVGVCFSLFRLYVSEWNAGPCGNSTLSFWRIRRAVSRSGWPETGENGLALALGGRVLGALVLGDHMAHRCHRPGPEWEEGGRPSGEAEEEGLVSSEGPSALTLKAAP